MKQLFKQGAVLAAVVLACSQANAMSTIVGNTFADGVQSEIEAATAIVKGAFFDTYEFSLTTASTITSFFTNNVPTTALTGTYSLFSTSGLVKSGSFSESFTENLAAGDYSFFVAGSSGMKAGSYTLAATVAAVPEPETYALFLAGLGAVGFLAARRRSN